MDNGLIPIIEQGEQQAVSARALHEFLQVATRFDMWASRMFEYGFEQDKDFCTFLIESTGGRPSTDYALTIDCAKEIAMIQRTDRGKQARQYFIEVEKQFKQQVKPLSTLDILEMSISQLRRQEARISEVETKLLNVEAKLTTIDTNYFAVAGWYALHKQYITMAQSRNISLTASIVTGKQIGRAHV